MPAYEYIALNAKGRQTKGLQEGDTARQVRQMLRERGLMPMEIHEVSGKRNEQSSSLFSRRGTGLSSTELSLFTRQLATLMRSGLPLDESLTAVAQQREQARAKVRAATAFYIDAMGPTLLTGAYGLNDQVAALIAEGGAQTLEEKMPDEWIDWLAIAGNPAECLTGIQNQFAAGSTSVVLCVVPSEELPEQLEIISREILPRL